MAATGQSNNAIVVERLENLRNGQSELKTAVDGMDDNLTKLIIEYRTEHERIVAAAQSAHVRIDNNNKRIAALETRMEDLAKAVTPLIYSNRILTFISSAFVLSIVALIWGLLTGSINLVVP